MDKKEEEKVPFLNHFVYRTETVFKDENGNTNTIIDYTIKNEGTRKLLKKLTTKYSERLQRMVELQLTEDIEIEHQAADKILCEQLVDLGMYELVNEYKKIKKYYA